MTDNKAPDAKYIWDLIEPPGPQIEDPGPEPERGTPAMKGWHARSYNYKLWAANNRRWSLACHLKALHEMAEERRKDGNPDMLISAVTVIGAIILAKEAGEDRGLFG